MRYNIDDAITLVSQTFSVGADGVQTSSETLTTVYAHIKSISRAEWYSGGEKGLKPSFVAVTDSSNYSGQKVVDYENVRYGVYRTYTNASNEVELYCEEKSGV